MVNDQGNEALMTWVDSEATAAAIGVGALGLAWCARQAFLYLRWKLTGNGRCNGGKHCADHPTVMETLNTLKENYEDDKQIELYTRAIKRVNGGDPRD